MSRKILFTLMLIILVFSSSAALEEIEAATAELQGKVIPGPLGSLFGNEQINIYLTLDTNEEIIIGVVTKNKIIKSVTIGKVEKPSLNIYTNEATIGEILNAKNPVPVLQHALKAKNIRYKGVGFFNRVKFAFTGNVYKFAMLFNSDKNKNSDK